MKERIFKLKTLVLKLKPSSRPADLSSLNSEELDHFVDEMTKDLQNIFVRNIDDLRDRVKQARPDPSDPNYDHKMALYQELLKIMIPIIQELQKVSAHVLDELHALINRLWDDISKNEDRDVDRLLNNYEEQTENYVHQSFIKPLDVLEKKLNEMKQAC